MPSTVYEIVKESAENFADHIAVIDRFGSLRFSELGALVDSLNDAVTALNLPPGTGVALQAPNGRAFIALLFALARARLVVIPVSTNSRRAELDALKRAVPFTGILTLLGSDQSAEILPVGDEQFHFVRQSDEVCPLAPHIENPAVVRPSSGTTGRAKGVILSHRSVLERVNAAVRALMLTEQDRVLWVLPMAHHFIVSILAYIRSGATVIVCRDSFPATILQSAIEHAATILYAAPSHYELLVESAEAQKIPSLRFAICTSAAASSKLCADFEKRFSHPLRQVFGAIEVGLPLGNLDAKITMRGSIGMPQPGFEVAVLAHNSLPCALEEEGELAFKGPGMFDGYVTPRLCTASLLQDGWFLSGDIACKHVDGSFSIRGRSKAVIITAGNKVHPEEVEEVIKELPAVAEVRVFGRRTALVGEVVCAQVVLHPHTQLMTSELRHFCKARLSSYKTPQEIEFVDCIPHTASGKVVRH